MRSDKYCQAVILLQDHDMPTKNWTDQRILHTRNIDNKINVLKRTQTITKSRDPYRIAWWRSIILKEKKGERGPVSREQRKVPVRTTTAATTRYRKVITPCYVQTMAPVPLVAREKQNPGQSVRARWGLNGFALCKYLSVVSDMPERGDDDAVRPRRLCL